ncbi:MAG TPA: GDSL-type esterase/lipase family protein [Xanthobacteraceae bacterium]|nr:GDSL-type esterase/lipase family protein [Xanthobacteraceae bacterium]
MQLWMRRNPLSFLFAAVVTAFLAGVIGAILTDTPREQKPPPRTHTRVEPPYQPPPELPKARQERADAPKPEIPQSTEFESMPEETPHVPTLPPRSLDPIEMQRKSQPPKARAAAPKSITILQIGDSHTAADFLTGELRRQLQARYGDGGAGYMSAGRPHMGVRSSAFRINASDGWSYEALQQSVDVAKFWLSGFNAIARESGETISFKSDTAFNFDRIEIQALRQPKGGTIEIRLDGVFQSEVNLSGEAREPVVIQLLPERAATDRVREITITTKGEGVVNLSSVAVYNRQSGLSYNNVGFPGATVDIINKFDEVILENELKRLAPQIVVLAFGTNEGFNDALEIERYRQGYERVINKIRRALPETTIVLMAPPDGARAPKKDADKNDRKTPPAKAARQDGDCGEWKTPVNLNRVRDMQEQIAKRYKLVYWNWASIMPAECGADRWANMSPPLVAKDRVHFTMEGYRQTAAQFLKVLLPVIEQVRQSDNVVSNH